VGLIWDYPSGFRRGDCFSGQTDLEKWGVKVKNVSSLFVNRQGVGGSTLRRFN